MVVAPPSAHGTPWARKFAPLATGIASGWMTIRGTRRRKALDRGFILSDHVDWPGLLGSVAATGASRVLVTHGYTSVVVKWLREQGLQAEVLATRYEGERDDGGGEAGDLGEGDLGAARGDGRRGRQRSRRRPDPGGSCDGPRRRRMKAFADLYTTLDETTKTNEKVEALTRYFAGADPTDAAWAIYFLSGRKPKQAVPSKKLREWAAEEAEVPEWLFNESYDAVGDVAETVALLLPPPERSSDIPLSEWVRRLLTLRDSDEATQRAAMLDAWRSMDRTQRFVWNKLISGSFRVGVSQQLVTRAIGKAGGVDPAVVAHRLMGDWEPTPTFYARLLAADATDADHSRPYPFCLAHAIEGEPAALGPVEEWQAEWKWDGIRSQLIRRGGDTFLWSRGEELVTDRYPEIATLGAFLPEGTAIDGEILPYLNGSPLCRSPSSSGGSAGRRWARRSWPRSPSSWSPTT